MSEDMDIYLQIADAIKWDVNLIIRSVLSGNNEKYKYYYEEEPYVRWGLVLEDIHKAIDYHLTCKNEESIIKCINKKCRYYDDNDYDNNCRYKYGIRFDGHLCNKFISSD